MFACRTVARSRSHLCAVTNFEPAFNDDAAFDATAKIDFAHVIFASRQANRKRLLRLKWLQKFDCPNCRQLTAFLPITQCDKNFIENQYTCYERRVRKVSRQAGMIGRNRAADFQGHGSEVFLIPAAPATRATLVNLLTYLLTSFSSRSSVARFPRAVRPNRSQ